MKLSIVSRGRNDNYGNYYIERTRFCLERYIDIFKELNLTPNNIEVVFVDWGSDKPLYDIMPNSNGFIRYIMVPKQITENFDPPDSKFSFVHSINTGIARCKGKHIVHVDFDIYTDPNSMKNLLAYVDSSEADSYQHYFTRFAINPSDYIKFFSGDTNYYNHNIVREKEIPDISGIMNFCGGATGIMISKDNWFKIRGYDERYIYWGAQDTDLFTRLSHMGLPSKNLSRTNDVKFIHMEHNRILNLQNTNNPKLNPRQRSITGANDENWGLQNLKFQEVIV
jgi:predicted glycosyltransferase involved in capsule biosynthesis